MFVQITYNKLSTDYLPAKGTTASHLSKHVVLGAKYITTLCSSLFAFNCVCARIFMQQQSIRYRATCHSVLSVQCQQNICEEKHQSKESGLIALLCVVYVLHLNMLNVNTCQVTVITYSGFECSFISYHVLSVELKQVDKLKLRKQIRVVVPRCSMFTVVIVSVGICALIVTYFITFFSFLPSN